MKRNELARSGIFPTASFKAAAIVAVVIVIGTIGSVSIAQAYSISSGSGTTSSGSSFDITTSSINQLVTPFENFFNTIQTIQPNDLPNIPNLNNFTNQIPSSVVSPTLQQIIVKAFQVIGWLVGQLQGVSTWIANWAISALHQQR